MKQMGDLFRSPIFIALTTPAPASATHHIHQIAAIAQRNRPYDDFRDEYLLLTVTGPDAHNRKEWGSFLRTMRNDIVEPWIVGKIRFPDLDDL